MIRISRNKPAPQSLVTNGTSEHQKAKDHYALDINDRDSEFLSSSFFKAYSSTGVKITLNEMFHRKCAYCESKAQPTGYFAIEHFRPKASVKINGKLVPPGYWWLAHDWENLLPSCNQCNSSHKGNLFPIAGQRATNSNSRLTDEKRLLVHPCKDKPEVHFEFWASGEILAKTRKGTNSIEVYGLARIALTEERKTWLKLAVQTQEKKTREAVVKQKNGSITKTELADEIRALMRLRDDDSRYAGATRQVTSKTVDDVSSYLHKTMNDKIATFVNANATPENVLQDDLVATEDALDNLLLDLAG